MDGQDRESEKNHKYYPSKEEVSSRSISNLGVSLNHIKSLFIASGLDVQEISKQTFQPVEKIQQIVKDHKLVELRKAYVIEGVNKLQNVQLQQSQKLMDLENDFKKMRILQLEDELKNHLAYYARHGDFVKRHPTTGEVLRNSDGIPMQIRLPNVARELTQLKESVMLSEGLKNLLNRLDEIINSGPKLEDVPDGPGDIVVDYKKIFGEE